MAYRAGMPSSRVVRVRSLHDGVAAEVVRDGVARIQEELDVDPAFPPEVEAAAAAAARAVCPARTTTTTPSQCVARMLASAVSRTGGASTITTA